MADRYFLNIGTSWNDTANWSDTSGGGGGFSVPTNADNVFFDANSGNCDIDVNAFALSVNMTGYTGTLHQNTTIQFIVGTGGWVQSSGFYNSGANGYLEIRGIGLQLLTGATGFRLGDTFELRIVGSFLNEIGGGFDAVTNTNNTVVFGGNSQNTTVDGNTTVRNLIFAKQNVSLISRTTTLGVSTVLTALGKLTIKSFNGEGTELNGGHILLHGDFLLENRALGGTTTIEMIGSSDAEIEKTGGTFTSGTLTINKNFGVTVALKNSFTLNGGVTATLKIDSGIFSLNGFVLTTSRIIQINGGVFEGAFPSSSFSTSFLDLNAGTLSAPPLITINNTGAGAIHCDFEVGFLFLHNNGLLEITGNNHFTWQGTANMQLWDLRIQKGGGSGNANSKSQFNVANNVEWNFTGLTSLTFLIGGDVFGLGSNSDLGSGSTTFNGAGNQSINIVNGVLGSIIVNKPSGVLTLNSDLRLGSNHNINVIEGNCDFVSQAKTIYNGGYGSKSITTAVPLQIYRLHLREGWINLTFNGDIEIVGMFECDNFGGQLTLNNMVKVKGDLWFKKTSSVVGTFHFYFTGTQQTCNVAFWGNNHTVSLEQTGSELLLLNNIITNAPVNINSGKLYLNGFNLTCSTFTIASNATLKIRGTETIIVGGVTVSSANPLSTLAGVTLNIGWVFETGSTLNSIIVTNYNRVFHHFIMAGAKIHYFENGIGNAITVNGNWDSLGTQNVPTTLRSTNISQFWFVNLFGQSLLADKVDVRDSDASGGAIVWARGSLVSGETINWNLTPIIQLSNAPIGNYTWGEILFMIRSRINEPEEAFFTNEEIMEFFNQCQLYFARETKYRSIEQAFPLIEHEGALNYQYALMPQDFLGVLNCGLQSKTAKEDIEWLQVVGLAGRSKQSYQSQGYYLANRGELHIVRNVDINAFHLLVTFYGRPINFSDPLEFDALTYVYDEYLEDVILGTVASCYLKRRDYEDYQFCKAEFDKRVKEAIRAEGRRSGHKQIQVLR